MTSSAKAIGLIGAPISAELHTAKNRLAGSKIILCFCAAATDRNTSVDRLKLSVSTLFERALATTQQTYPMSKYLSASSRAAAQMSVDPAIGNQSTKWMVALGGLSARTTARTCAVSTRAEITVMVMGSMPTIVAARRKKAPTRIWSI
tara:strand:+ start:1192 stop:1635 length:444 start_codon:yes stop_codon:yes gene_type:complete